MRRFLRTRNDAGAAAVEFGLVSVVLLTLLIGIIQFSIWFWAYQVGAHAAREGARVAAVDPCLDGPATARAVDRVGSAADGSVSVVVTQPSPVEVGGEISVAVTYNVYEIGPFSVPVVAKSATSRIEYIPGGTC